MKKLILFLTAFCIFCVISAKADDKKVDSKTDLTALQQKLNQEVLEKPFSVADEAKINDYINEATQQNIKPRVTRAPAHWRAGYTCADIYHYGWDEYRDCRYYRYYYGRYWY